MFNSRSHISANSYFQSFVKEIIFFAENAKGWV